MKRKTEGSGIKVFSLIFINTQIEADDRSKCIAQCRNFALKPLAHKCSLSLTLTHTQRERARDSALSLIPGQNHGQQPRACARETWGVRRTECNAEKEMLGSSGGSPSRKYPHTHIHSFSAPLHTHTEREG